MTVSHFSHQLHFPSILYCVLYLFNIYWNLPSNIALVPLGSYWSPATRASSCGHRALAMVSKLSQTQSGHSWTECG